MVGQARRSNGLLKACLRRRTLSPGGCSGGDGAVPLADAFQASFPKFAPKKEVPFWKLALADAAEARARAAAAAGLWLRRRDSGAWLRGRRSQVRARDQGRGGTGTRC